MKEANIERQTYSAPEVAAYLGISRTGAYNLMQATDFPGFRVNGRVLVTKTAFEEWLSRKQNEAMREREAAVKNGPWGRSTGLKGRGLK